MASIDNELPSGSDKRTWRSYLRQQRSSVSARVRASEAQALADTVASAELGATVCAYVPFGTEPGSPALLDALDAAGCQVLLPVVPAMPGPLDWAVYAGQLVDGGFAGMQEPPGPRLGPAAIGKASTILVPAMAVDHSGVRLGRGAGYYDRSLPLASAGSVLIGVVRDAEFVDRLPAEDHDVRMGAVLTPGRGIVRLPATS